MNERKVPMNVLHVLCGAQNILHCMPTHDTHIHSIGGELLLDNKHVNNIYGKL